jgi:hypothetical protein
MYPTYESTNHNILFNRKTIAALMSVAVAKFNQSKHNKSLTRAHQVQFWKPDRALGEANGRARTFDVGLDVSEHVSCGGEWILRAARPAGLVEANHG